MSLQETSCSTCWRDMVVAACVTCKRESKHHGSLHEITEWLRRNGWKTQPGKKASDPMEWTCSACSKREKP